MEQREIKFRVWDKHLSVMQNNAQVYHEITKWFADGGERYLPMQYIEGKDKNGREVYEGDIVTFYKGYVDDSWTDSEQGKPYQIIWDKSNRCFYANRGRNFIIPLNKDDDQSKYPWQWEVIGNIHQNPELLNPS